MSRRHSCTKPVKHSPRGRRRSRPASRRQAEARAAGPRAAIRSLAAPMTVPDARGEGEGAPLLAGAERERIAFWVLSSGVPTGTQRPPSARDRSSFMRMRSTCDDRECCIDVRGMCVHSACTVPQSSLLLPGVSQAAAGAAVGAGSNAETSRALQKTAAPTYACLP